jgi:hypothetical protein
MRIQVSGRFIAVTMLAAVLLWFLPASTHVAQARPIGWDDPTYRNGDSDGVVLKSASFQGKGNITAPTISGNTTTSRTQVTVRIGNRHVWKGLRDLLAGLRMEYFRFFWVR